MNRRRQILTAIPGFLLLPGMLPRLLRAESHATTPAAAVSTEQATAVPAQSELSRLPLLNAEKLAATNADERVLVLVQLKGGNDSLNTFIPHRDQLYTRLRPQLHIPVSDQLPVTPAMAFHPALRPLMPAWEAGEMAIIHNVGYPGPNLSHFASTDIWHTGQVQKAAHQQGWLHAALDGKHLGGLVLGGGALMFRGAPAGYLKIGDAQKFFSGVARMRPWQLDTVNPLMKIYQENAAMIRVQAAILQTALTSAPPVDDRFSADGFGRQVALAARIIASDFRVRVIKLTLGSFDTHASQPDRHAGLLTTLASNLDVLRKELQRLGRWSEVLVFAYSEFGRRVKENGNLGTDHGEAASVFMLGETVAGGEHVQLQSLENTNKRGNLVWQQDFRDIYAVLGNQWLV